MYNTYVCVFLIFFFRAHYKAIVVVVVVSSLPPRACIVRRLYIVYLLQCTHYICVCVCVLHKWSVHVYTNVLYIRIHFTGAPRIRYELKRFSRSGRTLYVQRGRSPWIWITPYRAPPPSPWKRFCVYRVCVCITIRRSSR